MERSDEVEVLGGSYGKNILTELEIRIEKHARTKIIYKNNKN